jgi:hypothetical protein
MSRLVCFLMLVCVGVVGCASGGGSVRDVAGDEGQGATFQVGPGEYAGAFDAARRVLLDARFELDRIDAAAGVITTHPKATSGLATPWDTEQSTFSQEISDMVNHQRRRVRVTFRSPEDATGDGSVDLRTLDAPILGRVDVVIERLHRPGWRLETTSIHLSRHAMDPTFRERSMWPTYAVAVSQDPALAKRLACKMRDRTRQFVEAGQ